MAAAPMDALASLVYLNDNVPNWISKISALRTHVLRKREEFTAEYQRVLEHARPKRKKTTSITSLQTNDQESSATSQRNDDIARDTRSIPRRTDISPFEPASKYLFVNARRAKRRQGKSFRSGDSGPQTFRKEHQVIIYYDSTLQNAFEALVKDVGTARNNLRKGRQARALERGLQLSSFGIGNYARTQRGALLPSPPNSRRSTDPAIEPKLLNDSPPDEDALFNEVATDLEAAQDLCETAAHQFLRDGDCTIEIDRIRAYFENVLNFAKAQIDTWEHEKRDHRKDVEDTEAAVKNESHLATAVAKEFGVNITPVVYTEAAEIEVGSDDDSADEDMVFDLSRFRAGRVNRLRA